MGEMFPSGVVGVWGVWAIGWGCNMEMHDNMVDVMVRVGVTVVVGGELCTLSGIIRLFWRLVIPVRV